MSDDATCDLVCLDLPRAEGIRGSPPPLGVLEAASGRAKALSDPTRLMVAAALPAAVLAVGVGA